MNGKSTIAGIVLGSGLALALSAGAATESHMPPEQKQGDIAFVTGGVGQDSATAMKHAARSYPLELEFVAKAKPKDEYLAEVKVSIKDEHDKMVLDTTSDGPFLLARLPAGKYQVSAEHNGKTEHRTVNIVAKEHRRVVFEWQS